MNWIQFLAGLAAILKEMAPALGPNLIPLVDAILADVPNVPPWFIQAVNAVLADLLPKTDARHLE